MEAMSCLLLTWSFLQRTSEARLENGINPFRVAGLALGDWNRTAHTPFFLQASRWWYTCLQ